MRRKAMKISPDSIKSYSFNPYSGVDSQDAQPHGPSSGTPCRDRQTCHLQALRPPCTSFRVTTTEFQRQRYAHHQSLPVVINILETDSRRAYRQRRGRMGQSVRVARFSSMLAIYLLSCRYSGREIATLRLEQFVVRVRRRT